MTRRSRPSIVDCALLLTPLAAVACGGTTSTLTISPDAAADAGVSEEGGLTVSPDAAADATLSPDTGSATCGSATIAFDLSIGTTAPVYLGGSQPPWPMALWCPYWLTITDPQGNPLVLQKDACFESCPVAQPQVATAESALWDGTYYPASVQNSSAGCHTAACAAPGSYKATFCVGYAGDAGSTPSAPTCKEVTFAWPPSSPSSTISASITPTP